MTGRITGTGVWSLQLARNAHVFSNTLIKALGIFPKDRPVLDLGCGAGHYTKGLRAQGYTVVPVDGTRGINSIAVVKDILEHDLTEPLPRTVPVGSVLCLEVAEHIPKQHQVMFLENLTRHCDGTLVLSWGVPGQIGHGHVNNRPAFYVINTMYARGFLLDRMSTDELRTEGGKTFAWFKNSIYVFRKDKGV